MSPARTGRPGGIWRGKGGMSIGAARSPDAMTREGSLRIEEAVLARLGYPAPRKLAVAANTLVIADTSGLHRRGIADGDGLPHRHLGLWPRQPVPAPGPACCRPPPGRGRRCGPSGRRRTCSAA